MKSIDERVEVIVTDCTCTAERLIEDWRSIPGYEGYYSVSNLGRVRRDRGGSNTYAGRLLKPYPNSDGYPTFRAHREGGPQMMGVHRALACAFLGSAPLGHEVNHKDGIKSHCHLDNLEYLTDSGNTQHAYHMGLITPLVGSSNPFALLDETVVVVIKQRLATGEQPQEIAKDYPVGRTAISSIKHGRTWSHVPGMPIPGRFEHLLHFWIVWDTRSVVGPFACAKEARRRQPFAGRRMGRSYATFNKRLGVVTCRKKVPVDIEKMIHQAVKKEG